MKAYRETYIRKAEIAQLVILHQLYAQSGSQDLIFQGGTALRWCYGGSRFSEDLDFVTSLDNAKVKALLNRAFKAMEREMIPHFGPGTLTVAGKTAREQALKLFVDYHPVASREKISVKLEFEGIRKGFRPVTKNYILSALPAIAYLIASGDFKVPRPHAVLVVETAEEILSDKVRALLERRYFKGRDIFDVWYLRTALETAVDKELVERKLVMYARPFRAARHFETFINPTAEEREELKKAISQDLARFLPPAAFAVYRAEEYASFLSTLRSLFADLKKMGVSLP